MRKRLRLTAIAASAITMVSLLPFSAAAALKENECLHAALEMVKAPGRMNVSCSDGLVSLSTPDGSHQSVHNPETHRATNVTGLSGDARKKKVQEVAGSEEGVSPSGNYIDSQYRGRTEDTVEYGTIEDGEVIFESSIHLRTVISLQARRHRLEVAWWENNSRDVTFNVPVSLYEDVPFAGDPQVGGLFYANDSPQAYFRDVDTAQTPNRGGVYYWYPDNMTIVDREYGLFVLTNEIEAPHFLCFNSPFSNCRYPNGEEA
jgi:hypothetical protein